MKNIRTVILGVDPGTIVTGYGIIEIDGHTITAIDFGCIRPPLAYKLSDRYLVIHEGIAQLIEQYAPTAIAVETQYVHKNVQSAIKLGMARGAVILAAKMKELGVFEYAPTQAKLAVVGSGKASKKQVQGMVQRRLNLLKEPEPEDAADALALAICHAQMPAYKLSKYEI
ncbi:MAG: crossover junction endodeoxyribonuclease RuvC [Parachlamydia sp.]|jgi:crossover junction endodeoxyribonuclease RuvC|nr:crossover junction endodeoxyribonuclease RuvC [Parachlamydia sp.]